MDINCARTPPAFRNGADIHAMTASQVFGVPVEGMDPMVRRRAKAINFGIIYGISAFGLANQLGIEPAFLGFIEDYYHMANLLAGHCKANTIIVDVGCAGAFQQVFFRNFPQYIGIDMHCHFCQPLQPNASFVQGVFADLVASSQFTITDNMVGIANMSLNYGGSKADPDAFNLFKQRIII